MLDLRLERIHRALAGQRLLQPARGLGLSRLPLGEQPLELAELAVDRLERVGAGLELAGEAVESRRLRVGLLQHRADPARQLLEPLRRLGRFLAQRRGAVQVLGGLVQRALALLELLAQQPDPLLELIELGGAALERAHRAVHRVEPALGRRHRGRHLGDRVGDRAGLLRLGGELA